MKTPLLILISITCLGAGLPHQAFGPLHFGMSAPAAKAAREQMRPRDSLTAADVRKQFVTTGAMRISRVSAADTSYPVYLAYEASPVLTTLVISSQGQGAAGYSSALKAAWEDFQDIGDCKFHRVGAKGILPPIESLSVANPDVITDTWQMEGVRVELSVHYMDPSQSPGAAPGPVRYSVVLRASEATAAAK
ncbi:MAG TPA: hypothetical protein VK961_01640 [Chthoniobacter sp.]|nr:hypothetical protein [Chthoniobacter sp.]